MLEKSFGLLFFLKQSKNHMFVDGNKRIAAFCFLLFLQASLLNNLNNKAFIGNDALASLIFLIASIIQ